MSAVTGKLLLDGDVVRVAEFMEGTIPADRLRYVADRLPMLARLIWSEDRFASLERTPLRSETLPDASEYVPAGPCVGDGSAAVADNQRLT